MTTDQGQRADNAGVKSPKYLDLSDFPGVTNKVRVQLAAPEGKRFWRSLDELSDTAEFRQLVDREFPQAAGEWDDNVSRRNFMKLMGASLALAGLTSACAPKPEEKIVPYVQQPEEIVPGKALFFATTMPFGGFGRGVLVEQHEGRPTKIEGNPQHPSSLGGASVHGQASILALYDPDRAQVVTRFGNVSSWGSFQLALSDALTFDDWSDRKLTPRTKPVRLHILTESVTSPTIKTQIEALKAVFPALQWHVYDPIGCDHTNKGARDAFGEPLQPVYDFSKAEIVVSLESNFLTDDAGSLRYARDFMKRRKVRAVSGDVRHTPSNRLFAVESAPTNVSAIADHVLRVGPDQVHAFAAELYKAVKGGSGESATFAGAPWFGKLVAELLSRKGKSIVVPGEYAPPAVHVLAHAINAALDNISSAGGDDKPVALVEPVNANPVDTTESLTQLTAALKAGEVDVLLMIGGNPAYSAPADLDFASVLTSLYPKVKDEATKKEWFAPKAFVAHLGMYEDETARLVEWHLPQTSYLEAWGDCRGHDGTASVIQPLIAPLYAACKSEIELFASLLNRVTTGRPATADGTAPATQPSLVTGGSNSGYEIVRDVWRKALNVGDEFEKAWTLSLHDGVIEGTAFGPKQVAFKGNVDEASKVPAVSGLTILFRPDAHVWDGAWANSSWLQECPRPLTKLTWDNALIIGIKAAREMGLTSSDTGNVFSEKPTSAIGKTVNLSVGGRELKDVPVYIQPGHPEKCATLHLGYGRKWAGRVGSPDDSNVGFNAYVLRTSGMKWAASGVVPTSAGGSYKLAYTQNHQIINHELNHKRELVLAGTSIPQVVEEYLHELKVKDEGEAAARQSPEPLKIDEQYYEKNIRTARRIGLPILPDDPSNSSDSLFPKSPDNMEKPDGVGGHDPAYPAWGMVIDLTSCIGCNACVVACQSENNIPVVGKTQVLNEREMHWLRIDTYYLSPQAKDSSDPNEVDLANPEAVYFQPLPCMQCEKAPCELVCPVGATVHSKEGLNDMAYNRCVGTRYCSNNCPYKVRRFNFLKYTDDTTPVLKLLRNPDVTVRSRGVMEKCTYCTQRISRGRIEAKKAEVAQLASGVERDEAFKTFQKVLDRITPACAQTCPTQAITFGNIANPESDVSKLKREPVGFHYGLLAELNTRPRTSYLARINNPLEGFGGHAEHEGSSHEGATHGQSAPEGQDAGVKHG